MDTNYLTTKNTKTTKRKKGGESRNHEWARMAGVNHEKREKRRQGRVGTTNGHEWQGVTTKHTKYTKKEGRGGSKNHEWTRKDTKGRGNHERHEMA